MYSAYRTERRQYRRLRVSLSVIYSIEGPQYVKEILEDREFEGNVVDLSMGGLGIIAGHYLPLKTYLKVRLVVFESDFTGRVRFYDPLTITGEIKSIAISDENHYRLGLAFKEVNEEQRTKLIDFISSPLKMEEAI